MDLDFRKGSLIDSYSKKLWTNNNSTEFMVAEKWQSLLFDASSSQSITYDDINNTMPLPTGDFSVRTIIKANSFPNAVNGILEYGDSSWRLGLSLDNTGKIYSLYTQATQSRYQVTSSIEIKVGEWYEIIQTHVSATDSTILYVNNISKTLAASANGSGTETNNQALIGDVNTSGSFFFDGYIASSQVYNHVLTTQERGKLYNEFLHSSYISPPKRNFLLNKNINPNEDGLVSAYDMVPLNGEIIDKTGNGNNGTIVNAIWVKDWLEFNDTDTLVTLTDGTILSGVTKATILTRAKFDTANGTICSKGTSNGSRLAILRSGGNLYFAMENGGTFYGTIADTDTTSYRNIAMVFDGSLTGNDRLKAYIDGVEVTLSYTGTAPSTVVTNSSFRLGLYLSSYFGGTIQEFKVYDDALSLDSIKARHNNYARQVNILEDFSGNWADWVVKVPNWWIRNNWSWKIEEIELEQWDIIDNWDFADWTADDPDDWTVQWEAGANIITQNGNACRFVSDSTAIYMYQTNTTVGKRYRVKYTLVSNTGWWLKIGSETWADGYVPVVNTVWTFSTDFIATWTQFRITRRWAATDTTITDISVEEIKPLPTIDNWTKYLECVNQWTISIPSETAYWTWEFDINKPWAGSYSNVMFISDTIESFDKYAWYLFGPSATESVRFLEKTSVESETAAAFTAIWVWYTYKITRTAAWIFSFYIKGWEYWDEYVLIDTTGGTGTNPTTNNVYTTSKYFTIDFDAWDKIANLKISKWVIV